MDCNSPTGAPTAGIGGATGADGVGEGGPDRLEFKKNSRAPALEAGGSGEFGALKTADREPVDATAPGDLVDGCGKRIGIPCAVGAARTAVDPITPV